MNNLFLIGFMGAGKSSVSAGLGRMLGRESLEMDQGIAALMEQRRPKYEAAADITVDTSHLSIEEVCRQVLRRVPGTIKNHKEDYSCLRTIPSPSTPGHWGTSALLRSVSPPPMLPASRASASGRRPMWTP